MVILCFCSRCITLLLYHLRAFMSMYIYNKIAEAFLSLMHTFCPKRADFAKKPDFYHRIYAAFSPDPSCGLYNTIQHFTVNFNILNAQI